MYCVGSFPEDYIIVSVLLFETGLEQSFFNFNGLVYREGSFESLKKKWGLTNLYRKPL